MAARSEPDTGARRIVNQLAYRYEGLFDRDRIDTLFHDSYDHLSRGRARHDRGGVVPGGEVPKPLTDEVLAAADVEIRMGCGDSCPVLPGKHYEDWAITDPAGQPVARVRAVRDQVDQRVQQLVTELLPTGA